MSTADTTPDRPVPNANVAADVEAAMQRLREYSLPLVREGRMAEAHLARYVVGEISAATLMIAQELQRLHDAIAQVTPPVDVTTEAAIPEPIGLSARLEAASAQEAQVAAAQAAGVDPRTGLPADTVAQPAGGTA